MVLLLTVSPDINAGVDSALYADARENHFSKLLKQAEQFSEAWRRHVQNCHSWVI